MVIILVNLTFMLCKQYMWKINEIGILNSIIKEVYYDQIQ